jgi:hypothetical protein
MSAFPPSEAADFGVVIAATPDHLHWVRGVCASIRYFMGDTPIALLLDGKRSVQDLRDTYGVRLIRVSEIEHPGLRGLSGSTKAKLAALWVAPFERFLFVDADAIVWGDVRQLADLDRFDFVVDTPYGPRASRLGVMDAAAASRHFSHFDAQKHEVDYVNTGVFFARRGVLELDRYLELVEFGRANPGIFLSDQGLFNFMLFSAVDEGKLRLDHQELQVKVGEGNTTHGDLVRRFRFANGQPEVDGAPVVIHWVGTLKPTLQGGENDFFEPMTFFRRRFQLARRDGAELSALDELRLRLEDFACGDWRGENLRGRLRRRRRRAVRGARNSVGRAKIAARTRTPDRLVSTLRKRSRSSVRP